MTLFFPSRKRSDRPCLVVIHIPKTAGTTLRSIMEQQFSKRAMYEIYDQHRKFRTREQLMALSPRQKAKIRLLIGHFGMDLEPHFPVPFTCYTMLRNPVEQVLSAYAHVMHHHRKWRDRKIPLEEYLQKKKRSFNNRQARLLSGLTGQVPFGDCPAEMLDLALANIDKKFCTVGIAEQFDQSIYLLARLQGWADPYYVRENVSSHRLKSSDLSAETAEWIRALNAIDIALYERVKARFCALWQHQDDDFHAGFARFQVENAEYMKRHQPKVVWK